MTSTLFQNILPEDIPVMLKRLNAYTKSFYPPGFPVWGGFCLCRNSISSRGYCGSRGLYSDVPKWENTVKHLRQQLHFPSYPDTQSPRNRSAEKYVSESEDQIYLP